MLLFLILYAYHSDALWRNFNAELLSTFFSLNYCLWSEGLRSLHFTVESLTIQAGLQLVGKVRDIASRYWKAWERDHCDFGCIFSQFWVKIVLSVSHASNLISIWLCAWLSFVGPSLLPFLLLFPQRASSPSYLWYVVSFLRASSTQNSWDSHQGIWNA